MSLLTKEQREIIERARVGIKCELTQWAPAADINDLLSIIDALQARAPKQYTELELFKSLAFEILRSDDYNHILDHVDKRMAKYENTNANRQ